MKRPQSRLAQVLLWLVRVPLAVRALLPLSIWLAISGLYTVVRTGDEGRLMGWLEALHSSARVFVLDPPAYPTPGEPAPLLWLLIFLAPLITTAAVADFVRAYVLSGSVLARGYANHVVVCGAGDHGVVIARRAWSEGRKVVLLDLDAAQTGLVRHRGFEAVVVRGDMVEAVDLAAAAVQTAAHVFFASGDPLVNLRGAGVLRALVPTNGPRVHVLADQHLLNDAVLKPLRLEPENIIDQFGVAASTIAAMPRVKEVLDRTQGRSEVAIIGFGRYGSALLRELQQLEAKAVCVRVVDRKAREKVKSWNEDHPHSWRVVSDENDALRWAITMSHNQEPLDLVFLCLDHDALSLRIATMLRKRLPKLILVLRVNTELVDADDLITCSVPRLFDQALGGLLSSMPGPG